MNKPSINIVWLKRDLRLSDHAPLYVADKDALPYVVLYVFDQNVIAYPDTSLRLLQFQYQSLLSMNKTLRSFQGDIAICHGKTRDIFQELIHEFDVKSVLSYQESGIRLTFDIDRDLVKLFNEHDVKWYEFHRVS